MNLCIFTSPSMCLYWESEKEYNIFFPYIDEIVYSAVRICML